MKTKGMFVPSFLDSLNIDMLHIGVSVLWGIEGLQEGSKVYFCVYCFPCCLSGFPLVSDGPMVQALCN